MARPKVEEQEQLVMKIDDKYSLTSDAWNIVLRKKVTRTKKGTKEKYEAEEIVGYYNSLDSALIRLLNMKVLDKAGTPAKCLKAIQEVKKDIEKAFSGITVSKFNSLSKK